MKTEIIVRLVVIVSTFVICESIRGLMECTDAWWLKNPVVFGKVLVAIMLVIYSIAFGRSLYENLKGEKHEL